MEQLWDTIGTLSSFICASMLVCDKWIWSSERGDAMNRYDERCPECGSEEVSQKVFVKTPGGCVCADCGTTYVKDIGLSNLIKSDDLKSQ